MSLHGSAKTTHSAHARRSKTGRVGRAASVGKSGQRSPGLEVFRVNPFRTLRAAIRIPSQKRSGKRRKSSRVYAPAFPHLNQTFCRG